MLIFFGDNDGSIVHYDTTEKVNQYNVRFDVTREHQVFWLDMRLSTGLSGTLEETLAKGQKIDVDLDMSVTVDVSEAVLWYRRWTLPV